MIIYLDNAATTPLDKEVVDTMVPILMEQYGNPSSTHALGRITRTEIEKARRVVAKCLHCSPAEIFFTSGGTEADNMALRSAVESLGVETIISSPIEHHAVLHTLEYLNTQFGTTIKFVKLTEEGQVDLESLKAILEESPKSLVSLMHGNNEIGTMIDLTEVGKLAKQFGAFFHSDTVQTVGYFPLDLANTPVDFITGSAHKFNGPKGVGFLFIKAGVKINPLMHGGAQERNMRGGTENVAGIVGLAKALEISYNTLNAKREHIYFLKHYLMHELTTKIPGIKFNGNPHSESLYTVLNVSFPPNPKSEMLLFNLDIEGIACSGGSACSSGAQQGSHVLRALAHPTERTAIRFSLGKQNTKLEIDLLVEKLQKLVLTA